MKQNMNQSKPSELNETLNQTYLSKEFWLIQVGSTWFLDSINIFVVIPISVIGFFLNILTFKILLKNQFFQSKIFDYMRVYTMGSLIMCLLSAPFFVFETYRFFDFTNSYETNAFGCYFLIPTQSALSFFNGLLCIAINLERVINFMPTLDKFKNVSFSKICALIFSLTVVINLPYYFIYYPSYSNVKLDTGADFRINYFALTEFGLTLTGQIVSYLIYFFRDVLILGSELILDIWSIILLKRYLSNKQKINSNISPTIQSEKAKTARSTNENNVTSNGDAYHREGSELKDSKNIISKTEKNIMLLVIIMCMLSFFEHVFFLGCDSYFMIAQDLTAFALCDTSWLLTLIKYAANFFLFLFFNSLFRKAFKDLFSK
jgi:hypothetical protein